MVGMIQEVGRLRSQLEKDDIAMLACKILKEENSSAAETHEIEPWKASSRAGRQKLGSRLCLYY
jgi:hypothetical protein